MANTPDLAVITFDLSSSGVNRNALRIAAASYAAGMETELWTAQEHGELLSEVPPGVHLRTLGADVGLGYTRQQRRHAAAKAVGALSEMLSSREPRVTLSAGNHVHPLAVNAFTAGRRPSEMRLVGRVSNALRPLKWSLMKLPGNLKKRLYARKRYCSMHRLIAVTDQIRVDLIRKMGVEDSRVIVIPNGIDLEHVRQFGEGSLDHPWFAAGEPPVVLGVGRLVPQKNFRLLFKSFAIARSHLAMRLVILGDGPPGHRDQLISLAREWGVSEHVWFAGYVPNPFPYYRSAGLFVLSSIWEGMSNVLLEAMASGCPVVSVRCFGGSAELLANGKYGPVVAANDPAVLAQAIVQRLLEPRRVELLRERASEFDLQYSMERYVSVIREELNRGGSQGTADLRFETRDVQ